MDELTVFPVEAHAKTSPSGDRKSERLHVVPCELADANIYIANHHRHHKPVRGHRFSLQCVTEDGRVAGVIIAGRPVARLAGNPLQVIEVTRCCTDGTPNAVSCLYGAVTRAAKAMGYRRIQTYTLPEEGGGSMRAIGWTFMGEAGGGKWKHTDGRQRRTDQPIGTKHKWMKELNSVKLPVIKHDLAHTDQATLTLFNDDLFNDDE